MRFSNTILIFLVVAFAINQSIVAQTDNYWSWSFNTPSTLMAGSVIAGNAGSSAVYYNPALVNQDNMAKFSLSTNLISLQFFNAENIAGENKDADQFVFKIQPRLISYSIKSKNKKLGSEVAILSPVSEEIACSFQYVDTIDVINRTLGEELYTSYLNYARIIDDRWVGGGVSYRLSERFNMGISSFLSIKTLKYIYRQKAKAYQENDSVYVSGDYEPRYMAESGFQEEFRYWYLSLIFKLGAQYHTLSDRFLVGINFTFSDVPIFGNAEVWKEVYRSNIFNDQDDNFISNENTVAADEDVKVKVKNPFSIAVGIQYVTKSKKSLISFSAEYFHKIDTYTLINSPQQANWLPEYMASDLNGNNFLSYYFGAKSITNFAFGFQQELSPTLLLLGGFRTDFTASPTDDENYESNYFKVNQIYLNKYHFTFGPVWQFKRYKIVTGLQYTFGKNDNLLQLVNYSNPVEYNPATDQSLEGTRQNSAHARLDEIALFFGLTIGLNDKE